MAYILIIRVFRFFSKVIVIYIYIHIKIYIHTIQVISILFRYIVDRFDYV